MREASEAIAVNTGPLVGLVACDGLELLHRLHAQVVATPAGVREFTRGSAQLAARALPPWLEIQALAAPIPAMLRAHLDEGEASAIAVALERDVRLVAIDERRGRLVAREMGLRVTGSLGVLLRAKRLGLIDAVAPRLDAMRRAGIWMADALIRKVLAEAAES